MFVYFIMDIVQSWATIFRIAHHKNYPWCALMAQGFAELDNWQLTSWSESLSTFIQLEPVMNELLCWMEKYDRRGFFCSVIKPWLMTYVWGKLCGFSCYNIKFVVLIKAPISLMLQFISGMCDFWVFPLVKSLGSWHIFEVNFVLSSIKM